MTTTELKTMKKVCIDHIFKKNIKNIKYKMNPFIIKTSITDHISIALDIIISKIKHIQPNKP